MTTTPHTRQAVSIKTAADMYDVSPDTIRAALRSGQIAGRKVGRVWLIPTAALAKWFDSLPEA